MNRDLEIYSHTDLLLYLRFSNRQRLDQPSQRSPYTELAGLVVAAEDGEIQLDCGWRVIRVLVEGAAPAEGDWIHVAGTLYGEVSPKD